MLTYQIRCQKFKETRSQTLRQSDKQPSVHEGKQTGNRTPNAACASYTGRTGELAGPCLGPRRESENESPGQRERQGRSGQEDFPQRQGRVFSSLFKFYFLYPLCVSCTDRLKSVIFFFFWKLPVYKFVHFSLGLQSRIDLQKHILLSCHLSFNLVNSNFYILTVLNHSPIKSVNIFLYDLQVLDLFFKDFHILRFILKFLIQFLSRIFFFLHYSLKLKFVLEYCLRST